MTIVCQTTDLDSILKEGNPNHKSSIYWAQQDIIMYSTQKSHLKVDLALRGCIISHLKPHFYSNNNGLVKTAHLFEEP